MLKRSYLILLVAVVLGTGAAFAYEADADSDSQSKEKQESEARQKEKSLAEAYSLPVIVGSGAYLGVYLDEVTAEQVRKLGLGEERGALVMRVVEGSPAEKSGLKENDVIVSFNGRHVESVRELQRLLGETPEGRTVSMEVIRSGGRQSLSATLAKRSSGFGAFGPELKGELFEQSRKQLDEMRKKFEQQRGEFDTFNFTGPRLFENYRDSRLGVSVETLGGQLAEYFGVKEGKGLLVSEVIENSAAAKAGLKAGDVIIAADNEKVERVKNLSDALRAKGEGVMTLTIVRNRSEQTITVQLEKAEPRPRPQPRRRAVATGSVVDVA